MDGRDVITTAAVSDSLPVSVLLGWNVPEPMSYFTGDEQQRDLSSGQAFVVTRQQAHGQQPHQSAEAQEKEPHSTELVDSILSNLDVSLFSPESTPKPTLTRSQKRENRRRFRLEQGEREPCLNIAAAELRALQEEDPTLHHARSVADGAPTAGAGEEFVRRDGLLYRRYTPPGNGEDTAVEQLILPTQCRAAVLRLAHDIPLAGHLGKKKTADRVLRRFFWPGIYRDVQSHCQACERCQKSTARRPARAPLIPLPIMDEPFKRIAMDIVGPLPRSSSGKRYILVICDYATRYPEAIALRTIDTPMVAEELVKFFARMGVPEEILTDQGTNFTSQLLHEVYQLLHIKPIRTTPYHPQTDGLVERFNGTLKAMLRKTVDEEGRDWDRLLPYLLFAYREVPQASTGFSPFELVYGRHVRGPLYVLKESWEASKRSTESVVSYVLTIQERLKKLRDIVQENLKAAQATQKAWYDRHSRDRAFNPGDKVLVLLPTSTNRLLASWRGPYPVVRRVSPVNYEVEMADRRKKKGIFHINMLQLWHPPCVLSLHPWRNRW